MSVKITIRENGPLRVEGEIELVDHEGKRVETPQGRPFSLCRCGGSQKKPFCDGTHSRIGFIGAAAAVEAAEETRREGEAGG